MFTIVHAATGQPVTTAPNYGEALRVADHFTRLDRTLHTVRPAKENDPR